MMNTYGGNQEDRFEDITQHSNGKLYCIAPTTALIKIQDFGLQQLK